MSWSGWVRPHDSNKQPRSLGGFTEQTLISLHTVSHAPGHPQAPQRPGWGRSCSRVSSSSNKVLCGSKVTCPFPPPLTFHCPEGDNGDTYFEGTVGCEDPSTEVCHHEMTLCFPGVTVHRLPKVASPPRSPIFPLSGVRLTFFHLKLHPKHE